MVTVHTTYFNTGNSTSALSVYVHFSYDSFSENLLFQNTAIIPCYFSLKRILSLRYERLNTIPMKFKPKTITAV